MPHRRMKLFLVLNDRVLTNSSHSILLLVNYHTQCIGGCFSCDVHYVSARKSLYDKAYN